MATKHPIVIYSGRLQELVAGDAIPIADGGTGAVTASAALTALGAAPIASPAFTGSSSFTAPQLLVTNGTGAVSLVVTSQGTAGGADAELAVNRVNTAVSAGVRWKVSSNQRWAMDMGAADTGNNLATYYFDNSNVQQLFAYYTRGGSARFYPVIEASGNVQIGSSSTAANNFTMRVDGVGALRISRGNNGATTADPVTISAANVVTLAQPLPIGSGGTGDTGTAWTSVAATFAPITGAFADASGLVWYKRIGKTVFINASLTITNNNTGGGGVRLTLPWTANNGAVLAGREDAATGNMLQAVCTPGTKNCTIFTYNNNYPGGTGYVMRISGVYETSDA